VLDPSNALANVQPGDRLSDRLNDQSCDREKNLSSVRRSDPP